MFFLKATALSANPDCILFNSCYSSGSVSGGSFISNEVWDLIFFVDYPRFANLSLWGWFFCGLLFGEVWRIS